ncbi:MAG: aspartate carbamoyltransferase [Burkholderiales bacterium RIFCSPLOWO2_02_FULL_57_36]|nr:MAG: aspartate carbamoyltransferase [Burkholderiales bacterium RIFCSPLOWO2_02_FULL_57_36]
MKKLGLLVLATIVLSSASAVSVAAADKARQDIVAKRGPDVMPFALNATTHIFTKTKTGGIQQVVVKSAKNTAQTRLIRAHLKEIAAQFSKGDFSGPSHIHGADMPGLAELKQADPSAIKVRYKDIRSGARIAYATDNPELVQALHKWFDAQLSDHGHDAMEEHDHSRMHR